MSHRTGADGNVSCAWLFLFIRFSLYFFFHIFLFSLVILFFFPTSGLCSRYVSWARDSVPMKSGRGFFLVNGHFFFLYAFSHTHRYVFPSLSLFLSSFTNVYWVFRFFSLVVFSHSHKIFSVSFLLSLYFSFQRPDLNSFFFYPLPQYVSCFSGVGAWRGVAEQNKSGPCSLGQVGRLRHCFVLHRFTYSQQERLCLWEGWREEGRGKLLR